MYNSVHVCPCVRGFLWYSGLHTLEVKIQTIAYSSCSSNHFALNSIPSLTSWYTRHTLLRQGVYLKYQNYLALQWRHDGCDGVSNDQPHDCLLNDFFRRRSKKTWKLRVTGLCGGNLPVTGEFPAQRASNAGNVSIWWRHHGMPANSVATHTDISFTTLHWWNESSTLSITNSTQQLLQYHISQYFV